MTPISEHARSLDSISRSRVLDITMLGCPIQRPMRAESILQAEVVTVSHILHQHPTTDQIITLIVNVFIKKATYK